MAALVRSLAACGADANPPDDPPGTDVRVNDIAVRYAHLEDPDADDGYREGDDVPLCLWTVDESGGEAALRDVPSPVAADVTLTEGRTPVDLPVGELLRIGPDDVPFVLRDITRQVRGAEFVPVTLDPSDGTVVEIMVEAIEIGPLD